MDAKKLGRFIAETRKRLDMRQVDLANVLHVTDKAISRWERGQGLPDINVIEQLSEALGVRISDIFDAGADIVKEDTRNIFEEETIIEDTSLFSTEEWIEIIEKMYEKEKNPVTVEKEWVKSLKLYKVDEEVIYIYIPRDIKGLSYFISNKFGDKISQGICDRTSKKYNVHFVSENDLYANS